MTWNFREFGVAAMMDEYIILIIGLARQSVRGIDLHNQRYEASKKVSVMKNMFGINFALSSIQRSSNIAPGGWQFAFEIDTLI